MPNESLIRCEVYCQKGRQYSAAFPLGGGYSSEQIQIGVAERAEDGCRIGSVRVWLQNNYNTESWNLRLETPVKVWLPFPRPEAMTALYLLNEWWTRPAFVSRFEDIPDRTQVLLMRYPDRCGCFVPMVGRAFKAILGPGTAGALALAMQSGTSGARELDEPLYLYAEGATLAEAVRKAFRWLAGEKNLRLRAERRIPEMLRYLGWCSWDAFYREVSEAGIRQKAEELRAKEVPVRWMMIDDGWFKAEENVLLSMTPDPAKFPQGFGGMVRDLREKYGVRWVGVWHTLAGFWGGLQPGSAPAEAEKAYLCRSASGKILPSPVHGAGFYRDWYDLLRRQGIRFVKVDGQSSTACHFENTIPLAEAAAGLGRALEEGSAAMDGDVINCMGMAMETILARPVSGVSRNSDDFFPMREGSFTEHLLQNAYNALYHNELYHCDWDMFWTVHPDAPKHALLRAVSGGPVYVSDPPGRTDPAILKPLAWLDGRLLMLSRSAKPTDDCLFADPRQGGVLKLHNAGSGGAGTAGVIAAYNLTGTAQSFSFTAGDVPELDPAGSCWVWDFFARTARRLEGGGRWTGFLPAGGYGLYLLLPEGRRCTFLGRTDKYAGFLALETVQETENTTIAVLYETGPVGWLAAQPPRRVAAGGLDLTGRLETAGPLCTLSLPEAPDRMVLEIDW